MLCDICHKHIATVHLTEIVNGKANELHVCQGCAKNKTQQIHDQFDISNFLGGLITSSNVAPAEKIDLKCEVCGLTFQNFQKKGKLGCSQCYAVFKKQLMPLLKGIHGSNKHCGKRSDPKEQIDTTGSDQLKNLNLKLKQAIELENYEEAVKLRDKISELEKNLKNK